VSRVRALRKDERELAHLVEHYDGRIVEADRRIAALWRRLEELSLLEDTTVIVTSDHGMEWGERGLVTTCFHDSLWESVIRVPLMMWGPDVEAGRRPEVVGHADIAPTILQEFGMEAPASFVGRSLDRRVSGEVLSAASSLGACDTMTLFSLRYARWKLIVDEARGRSALYDMEDDPGETKDVSSEHPDTAQRLLERLRALRTNPSSAETAAR
jgi:arylsulfatase A-like enzyme